MIKNDNAATPFLNNRVKVLATLLNKTRLLGLFYHPKEFFCEYLYSLENQLANRIPWIDGVTYRWSCERLHRFMEKEKCLSDVLYTAYNYSGYWSYRSIRPMQIQAEMELLMEELKELYPCLIVEIGMAMGGSLYVWSRLFGTCRKIVSIDLPTGYPPTKMKFLNLFDPNKEFHLLRGDSHSKDIVDELRRILKGAKIDFLFIDGDHRYESVKLDYEIYRRFVGSGGVIAFHDIAYDSGVRKVWNELKPKHAYKEVVASGKEKYGIGLLYV